MTKIIMPNNNDNNNIIIMMMIIIITICKIIDFVVPFDTRVDIKELEKIEKYQVLARELRKIWIKRLKVTPIIIGALGTTPRLLRGWRTLALKQR